MSSFWKVYSFLYTQYLVGPPFAWITASTWRGMEVISLWHCSGVIVMNLVATHSNCTSPMDYISHHALHSHIPVHHYTNHTAVTIHSFALIASPHLHLIHPLTYKQHTYTHPLRSLVFPWLTFPSVFHSLSFRVLPGLLTFSPDRLLPALLTPTAYWLSSLSALTHCSASVYESVLSTLPSTPLFDICLSDLLFVSIKLQMDLNVTDPSLQ